MLNLLRSHARSWVVKTVLTLIILTFILFFGYSRIASRYRDERHLIAVVGDAVIPRQKFEVSYDDSLKKMRESFKENMPPQMEEILKQNVLDQLISRELLVQYAHQLGLTVTDEEVASTIRSDKNLFPDGKFDTTTYEERFLPYFRQRYGEDFEEVVARDLLIQKIQLLLPTLFAPWQEELEKGPSPSHLTPEDLFSLWVDHLRKETRIETFGSR